MKTIGDNLKLSVRHFHQGNSTKSQRHGHPYVTVARALRQLDNEEYEVVAEAKAMCSRHDQPKREIGFSLAVGRLTKLLFSQEK